MTTNKNGKRFPWHPSVGFTEEARAAVNELRRDGESVADFVREATSKLIAARRAERDDG